MMPLSNAHYLDDDKHAKAAATKRGDNSDGRSARSCSLADVCALCRNSFLLYASFLMVGTVIFHKLGGSVSEMSIIDVLGYLSSTAEHLGLLSLRRKIERQDSVSGMSAMTMQMYALVYVLRFSMFPELSLLLINAWAVKVLEFVSLLLVADVLWSLLRTHRSTYQKDLDVLRVEYLVPGCLVLALVLHPDLREGLGYDLMWTSCLYLDVLALMPQVAMMAKGGGTVEAPVSHFVAATALSRTVDLAFWYYAFDQVGPEIEPGLPQEFNGSGWLIVVVHVVHLLLVADFMYYYLKARLSGSGLSEDLDISDEIDV